MTEPTDEQVERAAHPIFLGVTRAPWTSRADDEPCPVAPFTKNYARNIARAALRAALSERTEREESIWEAGHKAGRVFEHDRAYQQGYTDGLDDMAQRNDPNACR